MNPFLVLARRLGGPTALADFLAIDDPNFRGGVRLGLGDVNGDGVADLLVGAGYGGGPRAAGFDGAARGRGEEVKLFADFFAYEPGLRNGINVCVGDVNGDGKGDLIFGGGPGGGPRVRVADGAMLLGRGGGSLDDMTGAQLANFFAGDPDSRDGVRVGTAAWPDGTAGVVGLDVATGTATVYGTDGVAAGAVPAAAGEAGFYACDADGAAAGGAASTTPTHFAVESRPPVEPGVAAQFVVVALDENDRPVAGYTGTVHLTSSDAAATLPADFIFTAADRGVHVFEVTLATAGPQTVTAADAADPTLTGSFDLTVRA